MKDKLFFLCLLLIFSIAAQGCAMGMGNDSGNMTITGDIRVVGNEPLTHVVLTAENEGGRRSIDYLITGPLEKELRSEHQGKKVTLEGQMCSSPLPQFRKCFRPSRIVHSAAR